MPGFAAAVFNAQAARGTAAVPARSRRARFVSWLRRLGRSDEHRGQAVAAAAAFLLLLAIVALLVGHATIRHPAHPPQTGGGTDAPFDAAGPAAPMRTDGDPGHRLPPSFAAVATANPTTAPSDSGPAAHPVLVATFKTERKRLSGYDASITIANPSSTPVDDWSVTVTLPVLDLRIRNVDGAVYAATGQDVTFTPIDSTRTVSPGAPVRVTFQVDGVGQPVSCVIDGTACVGLPERSR